MKGVKRGYFLQMLEKFSEIRGGRFMQVPSSKKLLSSQCCVSGRPVDILKMPASCVLSQVFSSSL